MGLDFAPDHLYIQEISLIEFLRQSRRKHILTELDRMAGQKEGKKTPGKHCSTDNNAEGHTENQLIMLSYFQVRLHKGSFEEVQGKSPPPSPIFSL